MGLLELAQAVITHHDGLVERQGVAGPLDVLVPQDLAQRLDLPEEARLVEGRLVEGQLGQGQLGQGQLGQGQQREGQQREGVPAETVRLAYGTELLDRLIETATERVPLLRCTLDVPVARSSDPVQAALGQYTGLNCVLRPSQQEPSVGWGGYLLVDFRYTADADERREGVVRVAVNEQTGADISSLHGIASHPHLLFGSSRDAADFDGSTSDESTPDPPATLRRVRRMARRVVGQAVEPLGESIKRRHLRDRARLRSYFGAQRQEMESRLVKLRRRASAEGELQTRQAKIDALQPQLERKLADLAERYKLRVKLVAVAAMRVAIQVRWVHLSVRRRQVEGDLVVVHNAATRAFEPLCCDACGAGIFAFALCDVALHRLCTECHSKRPSARSCPVCRGR